MELGQLPAPDGVVPQHCPQAFLVPGRLTFDLLLRRFDAAESRQCNDQVAVVLGVVRAAWSG